MKGEEEEMLHCRILPLETMHAARAQGLQWMMVTFSRDLIGHAADLWFIFYLEHNLLCSRVVFEVIQLCFAVNLTLCLL